MSSSNLSGKCIWLTGASSGIGAAIAKELVARGARVALTARREEVLKNLADSFGSHTSQAAVFPGDVTDLGRMSYVVDEIEKTFGVIDIVIANAGTHVFSKPEEFNAEEYMSLTRTNFGGMLYTLEPIVRRMVGRQRGHVVVIASLAGYRGLPRAAAYSASKAAIINFVESMRFHLRRQGIKVSLVNPGFVRTPLTDKNDFYMPFLVEADDAARIICDGIERRKKEIVFPFLFAWMLKTARIIPYSIYETMVRVLWRISEHK